MTYQRKMMALFLAAFAGAVIVGLVMGLLPDLGVGELPIWIVYPIYLALAALIFAMMHPWWQRLDDLQRQGQTVSWYWGGLGGALAMAMWLFANDIQHTDFGRGAVVMVFAQVAGYAIAYAIWWLRGRGATE